MIASVMTMSPELESKMLFDSVPRRKTRGLENGPAPQVQSTVSPLISAGDNVRWR
jgi:hypothetical protein